MWASKFMKKTKESDWPRLRYRGATVVANPAKLSTSPTVKLSINFYSFGGRFYRRGSKVPINLVPVAVRAKYGTQSGAD
jgi:hypothetical protein